MIGRGQTERLFAKGLLDIIMARQVAEDGPSHRGWHGGARGIDEAERLAGRDFIHRLVELQDEIRLTGDVVARIPSGMVVSQAQETL